MLERRTLLLSKFGDVKLEGLLNSNTSRDQASHMNTVWCEDNWERWPLQTSDLQSRV